MRTFFYVFCFIFLLPLLKGDGQIFFETGPNSLYDLLYRTEGDIPSIGNENNDIPLRAKTLDKIEAWLNKCSARGINMLNLPILDREGMTICNAKSLKETGFRYVQEIEEIFPIIVAMAKRNNMVVTIPLSELGEIIQGSKPCKDWIKRELWNPKKVEEFIGELGEYSKMYQIRIWVNEQKFSEEYQKVLSYSCLKNNITYFRCLGDWEPTSHVICMEDYATYPNYIETETGWDIDYEYIQRLQDSQIMYGLLGVGNLISGFANTWNKKTAVLSVGGWGLVPKSQHNVALYRSLQCSPQLYAFYSTQYRGTIEDKFVKTFNYREKLEPSLKMFSRKPEDSPKPIANLIISDCKRSSPIFEESLYASLDSITNFISASGMDLKVSYYTPIRESADLYYVFCDGEISDGVVKILSSDKPIFIQSSVSSFSPESWRKISHHLGFSSYPNVQVASLMLPKPILHSFPKENALSEGRNCFVHYHGFYLQINSENELEEPYSLAQITYKNLLPSAKVIAKDTHNLPLIIQNKNCRFVNGNFLHLSASTILTNHLLQEPLFYSPSTVYITNGNERTAIFASDDTEIDLCLPPKKIYHWKSDGELYENSCLKWNNQRLQGMMKKWELAILYGTFVR